MSQSSEDAEQANLLEIEALRIQIQDYESRLSHMDSLLHQSNMDAKKAKQVR